MNWSVINAGIRYGVAIGGTAITTITALGLLNADTSHKLVDAVQQLGSGLTTTVAAVTTIATLLMPVIGMIRSKFSNQVASVKEGVATGAISKSETVAHIQNTVVAPKPV